MFLNKPSHPHIIAKNERVSIEVSAPGWIIVTAISLMRFMGKVTHISYMSYNMLTLVRQSTGSAVDVRFLS